MNFRLTTRFAAAVVTVLLWAAPALPQQAYESNEKRIATLRPAEQAYERFRFWSNQIPRDQRTAEPWEPYRKYLQEKGFSAADAAAQIDLVQKQGSRAEIERWNRILTSEKPNFNTNPNEFLVQMAKDRKRGTALDVGMGQGRNAIWLAQQGWDVTGFDPAEKAVELAQRTAAKAGVTIKTEVKGMEDFEFGERKWDLILYSYVSIRGSVEKVQSALKPGGILIVEALHRDATKGQSIGGGVVFDTGDLPKLFPKLRVVRYEEPMTKTDFGSGIARVVRYCGERPE